MNHPKITPEQFVEMVRSGIGFAGDLQLACPVWESRRIQIILPVDNKALRPGGTVSGPVLMTLADTAMWAMVNAHYGPSTMAVTANLNIHFLRRPSLAALVANCRLIKAGRRTAVMDVMLASQGEEEPVAHATGSYAIPV